VPWCADCDRYLAPPTVRRDGTCPTCGRAVDVAPRPTAVHATHATHEAKDALPPIPWHFKALLCAFAVYLGYRFMQMGEWLLHRL
jgi:DNA-directed RNA polymerase subunit RPC12/RpoP